MKFIKQFFWSPLISKKIFFRYIIISILPVSLIALSAILFLQGQALFIFIAPLLATLSAFTLVIEKLNQDEGGNKLFLYIVASFQAALVYFNATLLLHPLGWLLAHIPFLTGLQGIFWIYREASILRFFTEADFIYFIYFMPWFLVIFAIFVYRYKSGYIAMSKSENSMLEHRPDDIVQSNYINKITPSLKYFIIALLSALLFLVGYNAVVDTNDDPLGLNGTKIQLDIFQGEVLKVKRFCSFGGGCGFSANSERTEGEKNIYSHLYLDLKNFTKIKEEENEEWFVVPIIAKRQETIPAGITDEEYLYVALFSRIDGKKSIFHSVVELPSGEGLKSVNSIHAEQDDITVLWSDGVVNQYNRKHETGIHRDGTVLKILRTDVLEIKQLPQYTAKNSTSSTSVKDNQLNTESWIQYKNESLGITFLYPPNLILQEEKPSSDPNTVYISTQKLSDGNRNSYVTIYGIPVTFGSLGTKVVLLRERIVGEKIIRMYHEVAQDSRDPVSIGIGWSSLDSMSYGTAYIFFSPALLPDELRNLPSQVFSNLELK